MPDETLDLTSSFPIQHENPVDYCLVEVSQEGGVVERLLDNDHRPWQKLQEIRKVCECISTPAGHPHPDGGLNCDL